MFPVIFFDADTQRDFIEPRGAYPVPDAAVIRSRLRELAETARSFAIPILASWDAHPKDDPQFSSAPPHCVIGTKGQEKIPETWLRSAFLVPASGRRRPWVNMKELRSQGGQIVLEKAVDDPFGNPATETLLRELEPRRIVIYGVATEGAVRAFADRCLTLGFGEIFLARDAVRGRSAEEEHRTLVELADRGVRFETAHALCLMASEWMAERRS
ncbi:MAG: cysteine hydrolase family protein [Planctomycetota bacterium]|nr:cysteine hydrolase family protein [Planctomycetota bacterium]